MGAPDGPDDLRAVLDALEGLDVEEAALSQPTLDDAFFALAGMTRATRSHAVEEPRLAARFLRAPAISAVNEVRLLAGLSLAPHPAHPQKLFGAVLPAARFRAAVRVRVRQAIEVPGGGDYKEYLVSGIFAQSMIGTLRGSRSGSRPTSGRA